MDHEVRGKRHSRTQPVRPHGGVTLPVSREKYEACVREEAQAVYQARVNLKRDGDERTDWDQATAIVSQYYRIQPNES